MRYLLLIHEDESRFETLSEQEAGEFLGEYGKYSVELEEAGAFQASERLRPIATATTVRVRNGEALTTDGPFAETKEQLGGFYMIDAKDLDEALAWAAKIPSARYGSIEVRPIWEMSE